MSLLEDMVGQYFRLKHENEDLAATQTNNTRLMNALQKSIVLYAEAEGLDEGAIKELQEKVQANLPARIEGKVKYRRKPPVAVGEFPCLVPGCEDREPFVNPQALRMHDTMKHGKGLK